MLCRSGLGYKCYLYSSQMGLRRDYHATTTTIYILIFKNAHYIKTYDHLNLIIAFIVGLLHFLWHNYQNFPLKVLTCCLKFYLVAYFFEFCHFGDIQGNMLGLTALPWYFRNFYLQLWLIITRKFIDHCVILVVTSWHHPHVHVGAHTHEKTHMIKRSITYSISYNTSCLQVVLYI